MTTLHQDLVAQLRASGEVTALVGEGNLAKIHVNLAPSTEQPPFVVMRIISGVPENTLTSQDTTKRLTASRVQVDSYDTRQLTTRALADAIDACLSALASPDLAAQKVGERDLYDPATKLHCVSQDFEVFR